MIEIDRIVASIKYISFFVCHKCGKRRTGSTTRTDFDGGSTEELKEFIDRQQQRTRDAPIGWSFCLPAGFSCDECTKLPGKRWEHTEVKL